jgi:hypothetical protein
MATVALCPNCGSQLGVPVAASDAAALLCPMCETQFVRSSAVLHELPMARVVIVDAPANFDPDWRLSDHFDRTEASGASARRAANGKDLADASTSVATATPGPAPTAGEPITAAAMAAEAARLEELLRNLPPDASSPATSPVAPGEATRLDEFVNDVANAEPPPVAGPPVEEMEQRLEFQTLDNPSTNVDEELDAYDDLDEAAYDEADEEGYDDETDDELAGDESPRRRHGEFVLRPSPKRRARSSTVRTLVGIVGGGFAGLLLAGYALIWLRGPQVDVFHMADWLPEVMLPASMQSSIAVPVGDDEPNDEHLADMPDRGEEAATDNSLASDISAPASVVDDPAVTPANHTSQAAADANPAEDVASSSPAPTTRSREYWPATPIVGDVNAAKLYSLDELTEAVVPAEDAARKFLAGDFVSAESQKAMGHAYIKLCAVAERYTLTNPDDYGSHLFTQQLLGKGPLQSVAGSVARRGDLARIAAKWWSYPKRQNQGIVVVGRVKEVHPQGDWTEATLDVEGVDPPLAIPVLMDGPRFTTGSEVAVAGVIVAKPEQQIEGYQGSNEQVVVGGYLFDPAKFAESPAAAPAFSLPGH